MLSKDGIDMQNEPLALSVTKQLSVEQAEQFNMTSSEVSEGQLAAAAAA
eukprot:gene198-390_t